MSIELFICDKLKILKIGSVKAHSGSKVSEALFVADRPAHPLYMPFTIINGVNEGPLVAITAGIHGTEYVGIAAALDLIQKLNPKDVSGGLVIVPVVNIPGYEWRSKCTCPVEDDYSGTRNINRLFPGKSDATIAHKIAHVLYNQIVSKANFLIDLHGGDIYEYIVPCSMVYTKGDKEFDFKVAELARYSGLEYCIRRGIENLDGRLTVEAAKIGVPAITIECGDHGVIDEQKVNLALDAVMNILRYLNVLAGKPKEYPYPKMIKGMVVVRAKKGGLLRSHVRLGSNVSAGEKLGEIQGLDGGVKEAIISPVDGLLIQWSSNPSVTSGESVGEIAEFG